MRTVCMSNDKVFELQVMTTTLQRRQQSHHIFVRITMYWLQRSRNANPQSVHATRHICQQMVDMPDLSNECIACAFSSRLVHDWVSGVTMLLPIASSPLKCANLSGMSKWRSLQHSISLATLQALLNSLLCDMYRRRTIVILCDYRHLCFSRFELRFSIFPYSLMPTSRTPPNQSQTPKSTPTPFPKQELRPQIANV